MPQKSLSKEPAIVPKEYAGRWIAWDRKRIRILASGKTLAEVRAIVIASRETDPGFEWVPPANRRIIGPVL